MLLKCITQGNDAGMMIRYSIPFAFVMAIALSAPARASHASALAAATTPIHQLRVYELFDNTKQASHARYRDHVMRLMARHGFKIVAAWESPRDGGTDLVYLLEWPDEKTMAERWAAFRADPEWVRIKSETESTERPLVGEIRERVLYPLEYSPQRSLVR
jgi:hypothetical protein